MTPMGRSASFSFDSLTASLRIVACIVSVVMLLLFPAAKAHSFGTHFRTPEVRRATERQTCVAHSDENTQERVGHSDPLPAFFTPIETVSKIVPRDNFESLPDISLSRLLNRLKLNSSGSGGQDPLLRA